MAKKVERTRGSGTLTEAGFKSFVISALRAKSMLWKPVAETRKKARVGRGRYKCAICNKTFKKVYVDHINPIVGDCGFTTWDSYINNMFCEEDNLQALCESCHKEKTNEEKIRRKNYGKH
jgi:5-methylcytosine-specific restriction endonuclease McrA